MYKHFKNKTKHEYHVKSAFLMPLFEGERSSWLRKYKQLYHNEAV